MTPNDDDPGLRRSRHVARISPQDINAALDEVDVNELLGRVDVNAVLERVDVNRLLEPVDPHDPTTGKHVSVGTFSTQADANVALRQAGAAKDRGRWVSPGRGEGDRCNYLTVVLGV